jgi:hypothetical protein
MHPQIPL